MKTVLFYIDQGGRSPVEYYLSRLSPDERKKCMEYIAYLKESGEQIRRPIGDYLGSKLYELRPKQTRIIYFFMLKDYAVLVHAFRKKTNAIPEQEVKIAFSRMHDFISRYPEGDIPQEVVH